MAKLEELLVRGATEAPRPLYCAAIEIIHSQHQLDYFATAGHTATYTDKGETTTSPGFSPPGAEEATFDLASTTGELARLGRMPRCYGALDGVSIASEETVDKMTRGRAR